jgi:hypothetical protein
VTGLAPVFDKGSKQHETATSLTLIAAGAIIAFAITAHVAFLNLQVSGWVFILTGVAGAIIPAAATTSTGPSFSLPGSPPHGGDNTGGGEPARLLLPVGGRAHPEGARAPYRARPLTRPPQACRRDVYRT